MNKSWISLHFEHDTLMEWPGIEPPPLAVPRKRTPTVLQCMFNHCATEPHKERGDFFTHYFASKIKLTEVKGSFRNINVNVGFVGVFQSL